MKLFYLVYLSVFFALVGCRFIDDASHQIKADVLFFNGSIYTVDSANSKVEAVAIKADTIVFVGTLSGAQKYVGEETKKMNLDGRAMYPGFVEGHAHLMRIGQNRVNVDLQQATSYEDVIALVKERAAITPKGEWILGRGWHQDKWDYKPERTFRDFPTHHELSEAVPDHPVLLNQGRR